MSARIRAAQNQLSLAAYDAEEVGRILRRMDSVMDAGGWGSNEKAEVRQVIARLMDAQDKVEQAMDSMRGGVAHLGRS
jgi:uncharacterized membrane protein